MKAKKYTRLIILCLVMIMVALPLQGFALADEVQLEPVAAVLVENAEVTDAKQIKALGVKVKSEVLEPIGGLRTAATVDEDLRLVSETYQYDQLLKRSVMEDGTIVEEYASSIVEEIVPYASYSQTYDDQGDLDGISRHKMTAYYDLVKPNLYQTYFDLTRVNYNRSSLHGGTASYSNMKITVFTSGAGYEHEGETALTTTHSIPDTNNYNVYPTAHDAMLQGAAQMTCTLSFTVQVGVNLYNRSARLDVLPGW